MALATERFRLIGIKDSKILAAVADAIVKTDLLFIREVQFDPQVQEVTFEGDDTSETISVLNGLRATATLDKFDARAISNAYNKTIVSTGLGTGITWRMYFGDSDEVAGARVGLECTMDAVEETSGESVELRITIPVCTLSVFRPSNPQYNAKFPTAFQFSAKRTTLDIAGAALPTVPASGVFWYLDRMS